MPKRRAILKVDLRANEGKAFLTPATFSRWRELEVRGLRKNRLSKSIEWRADAPHLEDREGRDVEFDPWTVDLDLFEILPGLEPRYFSGVAAQEVLLNRSLIESEPVYALLALRMLLRSRVQVPQWLEDIFAAPVDRLQSYDCGSLDAAFNHRIKSQKTLNAHRKADYQARAVHHEMAIRVMRGVAIDSQLFAEVGKAVGVAESTVPKLYRYAVEDLDQTNLSELRHLFPVSKNGRAHR